MSEPGWRPEDRRRRGRAGPGARSIEVPALGVAVAALAGAWVGHALEYLRAYGAGEFRAMTARSVHTYMGPVGGVLLVLAAAGVWASLAPAALAVRRLDPVGHFVADVPNPAAGQYRFDITLTTNQGDTITGTFTITVG